MENPNTIQNLADAIMALNDADRINLVAVLAEKTGTPITTATQQKSTPQQTSRLPVPGIKPTEYQLGNLFMEMGAPASNKGFNYLISGVMLLIDDPNLIDRITTGIYPAIANQHGTTSSRVERAIRHEIEIIYDTPGVTEHLESLGVTLMASACRGKPTNGEFLAGMARMFR